MRQEVIALLGILCQCDTGGRQEGNQAGLAALRSPNHQYLLAQVNIVQVELECLAGTQSRGGHQPDQSRERGALQLTAQHLAGGGHQRQDLSVAVDMGRRPTPRCRYQARWRNLGTRIGCLKPTGKRAHDAKPTRIGGRLQPDRLERPPQGQRGRHCIGALRDQEIDELAQARLRPLHLCTQCPARMQIVVQGRVEIRHCRTSRSGQSRAMPRSPSRSTFA